MEKQFSMNQLVGNLIKVGHKDLSEYTRGQS